LHDRLLILASASPRRHELLKTLLPRFTVQPSSLEEPADKPQDVSVTAWAEAIAYFKAAAVAEEWPDRWVLGADTIVACAGRLLGKPLDEDDARRMLLWQAGRASEVVTGVALLCRGAARRRLLAERTRVWMRSDRDGIEAYLRTGDWDGKAGAYGIQTVGDTLIERVEGSFTNVVGLPVERLAELLPETIEAP
jgi:septum formation protein